METLTKIIPCFKPYLVAGTRSFQRPAMKSCIHLAQNMNATELRWYKDVTLDAVARSLIGSEDLWPVAVKMAVTTVSRIEGRNPRSAWFTTCNLVYFIFITRTSFFGFAAQISVQQDVLELREGAIVRLSKCDAGAGVYSVRCWKNLQDTETTKTDALFGSRKFRLRWSLWGLFLWRTSNDYYHSCSTGCMPLMTSPAFWYLVPLPPQTESLFVPNFQIQ